MGFFRYGETETEYLRSKDKRLREVIDTLGHIDRECADDLFDALVNAIVGQQISTKMQTRIHDSMLSELGGITPDKMLGLGTEKVQKFGITFRKADYIVDLAQKFSSGELNADDIREMSDAEAIRKLSSLRGIGVWTAEMTLLFCLQRPVVFSYGDLAIQRGLRMVYHHKEITKERFERYRKRFSPYCSTASLYLWAVAGGAIPDMKDYGGR